VSELVKANQNVFPFSILNDIKPASLLEHVGQKSEHRTPTEYRSLKRSSAKRNTCIYFLSGFRIATQLGLSVQPKMDFLLSWTEFLRISAKTGQKNPYLPLRIIDATLNFFHYKIYYFPFTLRIQFNSTPLLAMARNAVSLPLPAPFCITIACCKPTIQIASTDVLWPTYIG
jgi:hypothetical protein